jgi:hypothetical protein
MRESIPKLHTMAVDTSAYDDAFMQLIREVIHHIVDEETILLPMAEDVLAADLRTLGTQMKMRRLQLVAHCPAKIAVNQSIALSPKCRSASARRSSDIVSTT